MDGATFAEWIAFDSIEPLDPAGAILVRLSGSGKKQNIPGMRAQTWQEQLALMQKHAPPNPKQKKPNARKS